MMKQVEVYKKEADTISEKFKATKKRIDDILENNKYSDINQAIYILRNCIEDLSSQKQGIKNLLKNMKNYLEENKDERSGATVSLVCSIIQLGFGIIGGIVTFGAVSAFYIGMAIGNGVSVVIKSVNFGLLQKNIEELKESIKKAEKEEKEINKQLNRVKTFLEENEEGNAVFYW